MISRKIIALLFGIYRRAPFGARVFFSRTLKTLRFITFCHRPWVDLKGFRMYVDPDDNASFKYAADRDFYEALQVDRFSEIIKKNPACIVVDVGASYGIYTLTACKLALSHDIRSIIAIEADPRVCSFLGLSLEKNNFTAKLINAIGSNSNGEAELLRNKRSTSDNRAIRVSTAQIEVESTSRVRTLRIDSLLDSLGLSGDYKYVVKIDVQGNEVYVLEGLYRTLLSAGGFVIFLEYCDYLIKSCGGQAESLFEIIEQLNADQIFQVVPYGFKKISSTAELVQQMKDLEKKRELKMQGPAADFMLLKNMNL